MNVEYKYMVKLLHTYATKIIKIKKTTDYKNEETEKILNNLDNHIRNNLKSLSRETTITIDNYINYPDYDDKIIKQSPNTSYKNFVNSFIENIEDRIQYEYIQDQAKLQNILTQYDTNKLHDDNSYNLNLNIDSFKTDKDIPSYDTHIPRSERSLSRINFNFNNTNNMILNARSFCDMDCHIQQNILKDVDTFKNEVKLRRNISKTSDASKMRLNEYYIDKIFNPYKYLKY
jgi:hypothetical protein